MFRSKAQAFPALAIYGNTNFLGPFTVPMPCCQVVFIAPAL